MTMQEGRKKFFFEKKNQKTFVLGTRVFSPAKPKAQKFFAELFFKKATACLLAARKAVDRDFRSHDGLGRFTP